MKTSSFLYPFAVFVCAVSWLAAQSTSATLSGVVLDPFGGTLQHASIEILNVSTGVDYTTETNGAGIYAISILPPGQYRVQVSKPGFKTILKPGISLSIQSALVLNFTLPVGAVSETVTINAGAAEFNTSDGAVSTLIDRKFVGNIPLNGRSFQDLVSMTPGVVTQSPQAGSGSGYGDFSINGQRTESNYYTVDGISANVAAGGGYGASGPATSGSAPGATALGTTQSLISVDALEEFRVQSSTYSAEFGRSPGGQISMESRSGTNRLNGTVYDYLRNNYFDANDWFNNHNGLPITALRQNDFGGTLGGPLHRGERPLFFFLSYEGLRLTQPQAASVQYVPDQAMRSQAPSTLQPILNAFPKPTIGGTNQDYGTAESPSLATFIHAYSLPSQIDSTSVRLDHVLRTNQTVFFRFADTPSSTSSRILAESTTTAGTNQAFTAGWNGAFSAHMTNSLRFGYARSEARVHGTLDDFGGALPVDLPSAMGLAGTTPYPIFELYYPGIGISAVQTSASSNKSHQWNALDGFTLLRGHHTLKAGIDFRKVESTLSPASPEGEAEYASTASVLNNTADISIALKFLGTTPVFDETSFYLQDEWRISPRLTLSSGVRWEIDPPPTEAHGNDPYTLSGNLSDPSTLALAPRGTPLWNTSWLNFAPRLGLAWQLRDGARGATVLRGGVGVFFDTNNESASGAFDGSVGFEAQQLFFGNAMPFTKAQLDFEPNADAPYTSSTVYAFPKNLQLPYTIEWNVAVQQQVGEGQSITLTYLGSSARRLPGWQLLSLSDLNPEFGSVSYLQHGVTASYQALQAQFQRQVARGLQALVAYTWAHSIDFGSTYSALPLQRGDSDFDVRSNFSGGLSWDLPGRQGKGVVRSMLNDWGLDGRIQARTAFPVTLYGNLLTDPSTGVQYYSGVDLLPGRPRYLLGSQYPGGRAINGGPEASNPAFVAPTDGLVGNAPRNLVRGFGMTQLNLAARRSFRLSERARLQFRGEAFNLLNHPNFGYIDRYLTDATFGTATQMLNQSLGTLAAQYQQGGSRSMQFALKVVF